MLAPLAAAAALVAVYANSTHAQPPTLHQYYHQLPQDMGYCSDLIEEASRNVSEYWKFDRSDIDKYNVEFIKGNTRGSVRCLGRGNKSWVVILTAGGEEGQGIYQDFKKMICGDC